MGELYVLQKMKTSRTPLYCFVLASFCISAAILSAEISEQDLGSFSRPTDGGQSFAAERSKGVVAEIAKTGSFQKWKSFEDDKVKFSYPDHEAISLEIKRNEPILVDGDRVSNVDTSFTRAYRLVAAGETLNLLMLTDADWFDDGVCLCGAVVYERYLVRSGQLYRLSFLEDGVLKKMQVLGDGERLMMFEWTHLPIHPAIFRRIARSVELKKDGKWEAAECQKRVFDRYGPEDAVGWLDEGSTAKTAEGLLGVPTRTEATGLLVWDYPKNEDGYRWTERLALPFTNGKLVRFDSAYYDSGWDQRSAIKGSTPWMMEAAEPYEDPEAKKMPEELKGELLELFLEKAEDGDEDFNSLCQVLKILVEQGVRDKQALSIVRARFASKGGHFAAWVLHEAGQAEDVTLFIKKIREFYRIGNEKPDHDFGSSDLHNWLAFIPNDDQRYPELLRNGLTSPNASVRESAYFFLSSAPFPVKDRISFVHNGLRDSSARVRYWSTRYYARNAMSKRDWELLKRASELEKDDHTLKEMKEVLEERQERQNKTLHDG
jgi:hypothetical protein